MTIDTERPTVMITYERGLPSPWFVRDRATGRVLGSTDGTHEDAEHLAARLDASARRAGGVR